MANELTLSKLLSLTDEQKVEAFGRLANVYMSTPDPDELEYSISHVFNSACSN